jgi:glycolate oxidase FAD binding subunit
MPQTSSVEQQLAALVGTQNLRPATPADSVFGIQPQFVITPESEYQIAAVLSFANESGLAVMPRGGGTKLDWGNPPKRADLVISTRRLNGILEHVWADLTVTVEAGCTLQSLQQTLAQHGQRLALDALWPERASIGGVLSTNDSGTLRIRFGALRDLLIGITLALPDGTLASSGGKVVKNVAGYDLPKLATGALGTLGVITRAVFRLHPIPRMATTVTCVTNQLSGGERLLAALLDSTLAYSALQVRIPALDQPEFFVDVLFEGTEQGIAAQFAQLKSLASSATVLEAAHNVWKARAALHSQYLAGSSANALLKMSTCPSDALAAIATLTEIVESRATGSAVLQATGLATILLRGARNELHNIAKLFREKLQSSGGSLVALGNSILDADFDAWGSPGEALPLMRAIKAQLDPQNTVNPGRFVGGI